MPELIRTLEVQGPFRLGTAITALRRSYVAEAEAPPQDADFTLSAEVPGGAVELEVSQSAPGSDLTLRVMGDTVDEATAALMHERVRKMFSLDVDPTPLFTRLNRDPSMRRTLAICPDLRPVRYIHPFVGLITAIVHDGATAREAATQLANLREVCGVVPAGRPYAAPAFPGKYTLLSVSGKMLRIAGLTEGKIRRIKRAVEMLAAVPDPLERLEHEADGERALAVLLQFPGIDRAAALHLLQYAFGHRNLLLDTNPLRRAVRRFYNLAADPDAATLERLSDPYEGWRSWWSFMLITANETSMVT